MRKMTIISTKVCDKRIFHSHYCYSCTKYHVIKITSPIMKI